MTGVPQREPIRLPQHFHASPVAAADRVYFTTRDGTTLVIGNRPKLEVRAVNRLDDGIDASMALVDREILVRSRRQLDCIAER